MRSTVEKIKVLIVDDEPLVRRVLKNKVDWDLFDMTVAGEAINGEEALLYLDKTPVDLVITDIKMPYMDGNAFINEASKKFPGTRFFVLSAHSDFGGVHKSFFNA
jgi:two-component system, response regulator YesN